VQNALRRAIPGYGQVAAIMRTLSTFSRGEELWDELEDVPAGAVVELDDVVDEFSRVPVISTLCPTCGDSFASSASSRYSLALAELDPAVPVAVDPVVPVVPIATFVSKNFVDDIEDDGVVAPAVPVGDAGAF
jgi:hypothetical protein